jgi:hypothetical protein
MNELHPKSARHRTISRFSSSKGHGPDDELSPKTRSFSIYDGIVKANEYSRFSALNPAERGGNSRAKTVGLQPAVVREQAV